MTHPVPEDYRSFARQLAMQFLFQLEIQRGDNLDLIDIFLNEHTRKNQTKALAIKWIKSTWAHQHTLDVVITSVSSDWKIERLAKIDHANLRLGTWQLLYAKDIPHNIVIDQAIELAKQFSGEQSPGFVNGVLDAVWKKINEPDFDLPTIAKNAQPVDSAAQALEEDF